MVLGHLGTDPGADTDLVLSLICHMALQKKTKKELKRHARPKLGTHCPSYRIAAYLSRLRISQLYQAGKNEWPEMDVDFNYSLY